MADEIKAKKPIWKKWWFWIIIIFIIIIIASDSRERKEIKTETGPSSQQQTIPTYQQQEQSIKAQPVEYTIIEEENLSIKALNKPLSDYTDDEIVQTPTNIRMQYKILVPSEITKEELIATLIQVVKNKTVENKDIDEIAVFAYNRKQDINDVYTYGKVEWCPNGDWTGVTPAIASANNRASYRYVFDIKEKVGQEKGKPTNKELEIYDAYWKALNESGNPIGYVSHPTQYESGNNWEKAKMDKIINSYSLTTNEFNEILDKVFIWKLK